MGSKFCMLFPQTINTILFFVTLQFSSDVRVRMTNTFVSVQAFQSRTDPFDSLRRTIGNHFEENAFQALLTRPLFDYVDSSCFFNDWNSCLTITSPVSTVLTPASKFSCCTQFHFNVSINKRNYIQACYWFNWWLSFSKPKFYGR